MKIAIPVKEQKRESEISGEFGRSPFFAIIENGNIKFIENPGAKSGGGAGAKASQLLISLKVDKVILRKPAGPNASHALKESGIEIEITDSKSLNELL